MRFVIDYFSWPAVFADRQTQFAHAGLLVLADEPTLQRGDKIAVELRLPSSATIEIEAEVLQRVGGGVAVTFSSSVAAEIDLHLDGVSPQALAEPHRAPRHSIERAQAAEYEAVSDSSNPTPKSASVAVASESAGPRGTVFDRIAKLTTPQKVQVALHGSRDERAAILRDLNKTLHPYVLRNPGLQLEEVLAMARMATVSPELIAQIVSRKEWGERPDVAIALVRNPKTPVPLALKLLDHVFVSDLRQLAKDNRTRPQIQQAARKKIVTS